MINSCDSQRRFDRVFIWAFIAAFCVSQLVILFSYSTVGDLAVESDFLAEIAPAAQRLEIGELRVEDYPFKGPVSALAIAVLHGFTGQMGMGLFRTGNLLSIISAIIVLWSVFGIGLCCWNRKTAVAAAILTGINNVFFINAHKAGSDTLFLAIVMVVVYLTLKPSESQRRWLLIGVLAGLAFLTRYIGVILPAWLALTVFWYRLKLPEGCTRASAMGRVVLGFAVVVVPWLAINLVQTGSLLDTRNYQNIVQAFRPADSSLEMFDSLTAIMRHDPIGFLTRYLGNLVGQAKEDSTQVLGWAMTVLSGCGLVITLASRPTRTRLALLAWGLVYALALGAVFYLARFSLPLVPIFALLAASLLERLRRWPAAAAIVLMGFVAYTQISLIRVSVDFYRTEEPRYLHESYDFLKAQAATWSNSGRPRLMGRKPHAAWYGHMDFVPYPGRLRGASDLLTYAAENEVDFLVVGLLEHRFFDNSEFLEHLESYRGVAEVFCGSGNKVYRLNRQTFGQTFGTSVRIVHLRSLWEMSLNSGQTSTASTAASGLIEALDNDGRYAEARDVAVRQLEDRGGGKDLIMRLYVALASLKLNDPATGISILVGHLEHSNHLKLEAPIAKGYSLLGQLYLESGDSQTGLTQLRRSEALYQELGMNREMESVQALIEVCGDR